MEKLLPLIPGGCGICVLLGIVLILKASRSHSVPIMSWIFWLMASLLGIDQVPVGINLPLWALFLGSLLVIVYSLFRHPKVRIAMAPHSAFVRTITAILLMLVCPKTLAIPLLMALGAISMGSMRQGTMPWEEIEHQKSGWIVICIGIALLVPMLPYGTRMEQTEAIGFVMTTIIIGIQRVSGPLLDLQ